MVGRTFWLASINRTQFVVLVFLLLASLSLIGILVIAPEICDATLVLAGAGNRVVRIVFVAGLLAFLMVLAAGVIKRWRWTFWLVTVAFVAGVLRVPASLLQLLGVVSASCPIWYVLLHALVGVIQFAIGVAMMRGYRRAGTWAPF